MYCHENPARVNIRTCCMMGECNCACMPVQNPFGRFDLILFAFPLFCSVVFQLFFFGFPTSVPPDTTPLGFPEFFFCVVFMLLCLCAFLLFNFSFPELTFLFKNLDLSLCGSFVCEIL